MFGAKLLLLCTTLCLLATLVKAKYSPQLQVLINDGGGGVSGHFRLSHSGRGIFAFTNVPYAEPPVGDLRFAAPVKKAPWTGYLPSNRADIQCPQMQTFSRLKEATGQEDCLYLNLYVPDVAKKELPVMVFIHGGGFTVGTGSLSMFDPAFILDSDVILVTFNYRLGALGFLTTADGELAGNLGLKDQQLALRWVQENIEAFGGNPEKVTIFGVSAGGASVGLHMMSPGSKDLFQRAIMLSGTPYDPWVLQDKQVAEKNSRKLLQLVGCDKAKDAVKCLRKVDVAKIMDTSYEFFDWDVDPMVPFGPVLEEENAHQDAFITAANLNEIHDIPLMIGGTNDEGAFKSVLLNDQPKLIADLEQRFEDIIPINLCYGHWDAEKRRGFTEKVKQFYLGDSAAEFNWEHDKHKYTRILSDGLFLAGFDRFIQQRLTTRPNGEKTYVYVFNYKGSTSFTDLITPTDAEEEDWGVSHASDMMYLFPVITTLAPHRVMSKQDLAFGKAFVRFFTDFAMTGDPVFSHPTLLWNAASLKYMDYMRFGNCNREVCPEGQETRTEGLVGPFEERIAFWRDLLNEDDREANTADINSGDTVDGDKSNKVETVIDRDEL